MIKLSEKIRARFENNEAAIYDLETNLTAYKGRYPKFFDKVFDIATRERVSPFPKELDISVPSSFPEGSYPKVLLISQLKDPRWIVQVLRAPYIQSEVQLFIIVEHREEVIARFFQHSQCWGLFKDPSLEVVLAAEPNLLFPRFFSLLKQNKNSSFMESVSHLASDEPTAEEASYIEMTFDAYNKAVTHVYHNYGRIDDSLEGIRASLDNFSLIEKSGGITELKDIYKGLKGVVIGAGPSLDSALEDLKANQEKIVIIAVDAALKPLLAAGVEPDYVTAIERENVWQKAFYEGLASLEKAELVCYPVVHKEVLSAYPGQTRIAYRNYSYFGAFETIAPRGLTKSGGSAGHLALRLADWLGLSEIALIGTDACFETNGDTARSHCVNTAHPEWAEIKSIPDIIAAKGATHGHHFMMVTNEGSLALTNETYMQWANEFAEDNFDLKTKPVSIMPRALAIPGILYREKDDWFQSLESPVKRQRPEPIKITRQTSQTLITELLKACDAWSARFKSFREIVGETESEADIFDCVSFFFHSFYGDHLFVSFIVQCCAKEIFEIENQWHMLPAFDYKDVTLRKDLLLKRVDLSQDVVIRLANILRKAQSNVEISKSGSPVS